MCARSRSSSTRPTPRTREIAGRDPSRAALHLRPADVAERLRSQNQLQAVGRVDDAHQLVTVLVSGEPRTLDDLRALPVAVGPGGGPVPLSAIAEVREAAEDRTLRVGGPGGETVLLSVARLPGASTPDVVGRVHAALAELARGLPKGVRIEAVYDQAELVRESIPSVRDAILVGIALCIVVITIFLGDVRAGLVASLAVPLTLGMTFLAVGLHQSLNLMSLGGLAVAIGLVIDDAIVVVEAIGRRIEEGMPVADAAEAGTKTLFAAVVGTTLTTVIVFLPLGGSKAWSAASSSRSPPRCAPPSCSRSWSRSSWCRWPQRGSCATARRRAGLGASGSSIHDWCGRSYAGHSSGSPSRSRSQRAAQCAGTSCRPAFCLRWTRAHSCSTTSCPPEPRLATRTSPLDASRPRCEPRPRC